MLPSTYDVEMNYKTSVYPLYKQQRQNLLTLPAEIRDKIWDNLTEGTGSLRISERTNPTKVVCNAWSFAVHKPFETADLTLPRCTCKLMHDEILSVFYRNTKHLDMYTGPSDIPDIVPRGILRSIQYLKIDCESSFSIIDKLPALKVLILIERGHHCLVHTPQTLRQIAREHARHEFQRLALGSRVDANITVHIEIDSISGDCNQCCSGEEVVNQLPTCLRRRRLISRWTVTVDARAAKVIKFHYCRYLIENKTEEGSEYGNEDPDQISDSDDDSETEATDAANAIDLVTVQATGQQPNGGQFNDSHVTTAEAQMTDTGNDWLFQDRIDADYSQKYLHETLRAQQNFPDRMESHHITPELTCLYDALALVL